VPGLRPGRPTRLKAVGSGRLCSCSVAPFLLFNRCSAISVLDSNHPLLSPGRNSIHVWLARPRTGSLSWSRRLRLCVRMRS